MADLKIDYSEPFGINTFKREIVGQLGASTWEKLTNGYVLPDIGTESECKCINMKAFMERFDFIVDKKAAKGVLYKVRHGLSPAQSSWAREKFLEIKDLDTFIEQNLQRGVGEFENLLKENKDFYGDTVNQEVVDFVKANPSMLTAVRNGNKLYMTAFPAQMTNYLHASDSKMRRYYACHCPFAKESILADKTVSATLCNCSLGHVLNFWEAALDTELDGEVLSSVLNGDERCTYSAIIPPHIMSLYVKSDDVSGNKDK